ncbi:hypothetical protein KYG33_13725 [Chryseobacterium sp. D764]|uniref:hypothetical protein n=1 Tax=unclassified Chryseobacterium TaxID=2593645 RepID=UPI0015C2BE1D|nr:MULTISPECIES: hypothetical protein [unclassified Chryseobacterium]QXU47859.1 hypothetical protein KYG33_13725 [Chryseobacterium sp. D764]CAD0222207.1 conserved protein of unknown function [Chryseobacterium sp. JV274]
MKTSKDNIECQIKKQIEEREITPSRDLWSEIEFQNSSNSRPKSQMNWVLVAACLVLTLSLGTVLFFLNQPSEIQPEIVKKAEENKADEIIKKPAQYNTPLAVQNNDKKEVKIILPQDKEEVISAVTIGQNKLIPRETAVKKLDIPQISNPKLIAKADSLKTPVKKKKYVDPSTLLFSVEHKDVIEKTKDGSNVATTIDLNAR